MKIHYAKQKPRVVSHRGHKNFTNVNSGEMFLTNFQKDEVTRFKYLSFKPLNNFAPLKEKLSEKYCEFFFIFLLLFDNSCNLSDFLNFCPLGLPGY